MIQHPISGSVKTSKNKRGEGVREDSDGDDDEETEKEKRKREQQRKTRRKRTKEKLQRWKNHRIKGRKQNNGKFHKFIHLLTR